MHLFGSTKGRGEILIERREREGRRGEERKIF
jgi:hypothetical protein